MFKKKKHVISERDPTYKVHYLGNVQTTLMKGDGCVDKPTSVLWNNYVKNGKKTSIPMKLMVGATGLKVITKDLDETEYRANKISYCIAHPNYPRVFLWVYRHEGKRLKVELRCHAVLTRTDTQAKAIAVQLHDRLTVALAEFLRMKTRRQNARLALQRTYTLPTSGTKLSAGSLPSPGSGVSGIPARSMYLTTGQNFKSPIDKSPSAPKLGAITESLEEEIVLSEEDDEDANSEGSSAVFEFEVGNDVNVLKQELLSKQQLTSTGESDSVGDDNSSLGSDSFTNETFNHKESFDCIQQDEELVVSSHPNVS